MRLIPSIMPFIDKTEDEEEPSLSRASLVAEELDDVEEGLPLGYMTY